MNIPNFIFFINVIISNFQYKLQKNCKQLIIIFDEYEQKMAKNIKIILKIIKEKGILRVIK